MRLFFLIILFTILPFVSVLGGINSNNIITKSNPYEKAGLHYVSLSFGAAGWYSSLQTGMENKQLPISINFEYGQSERSLGLMLGVNMLSTYVYNDFLLNPNHLSLSVVLKPFNKKKSSKLRYYIFAGANYSYNRFTEQSYSGIINYTNKEEIDFGFGWQAGASVFYKIKNVEIGPSFVYNASSADFFAGHFTKQTFNAGSMQLNIVLKYNIIIDKYKNACPAYKNFQRFKL